MSESKKGTVLVIDDEPDIRDIMCLHLAALNVKCIGAEDGEKALEIIRENRDSKSEPIDVVISDIMMPNMSGLIFLRHLKKEGLETPCIFVTSFPGLDTILQAFNLGAFDYVEKPIDGEIVKKLASEALKFSSEQKKFAELNTSQNQKQRIISQEMLPHLLQCESSLVKLKDKKVRVWELGYLFRAMQMLRKSFENLEELNLARYAFEFENLLIYLRVKADLINEERISLLKKIVEELKTLINNYADNNEDVRSNEVFKELLKFKEEVSGPK